MKKLLLLFGLMLTSHTFSQVFWEERITSFANVRGVSKISIADENNVWLEAYDGTTPTNPILEFAKSTDGGNTWTNGLIGIPSTSTVASIKAISGTTCYIGASNDGLYKTTDGGVNWVKKTTGLFGGATSFFDFGAFVNPNLGVTVGDPLGGYFEIYRTTDGGETWSRIPSGSMSPMLADEYAFTNSYAQIGNTILFLTNKARTYVSNDAGLTWTAYLNPLAASDTTPGGQLAMKSETEGLMFNPDYQSWKTTDGGQTWVELAPTGAIRPNDISFVPGSDDTYVSIGNDVDLDARGTSYSYDGGLTWENINLLGDDVNVDGGSAVTFFNQNVGFASGFNTSSTVGGIFKYVGVVLPTKTFSNNKLFSANISNKALEVYGKDITNVTVFDVLGKQVLNNNFTSVTNASLNVDALNSAVYLVKVTNNLGNTSTIKVVKN